MTTTRVPASQTSASESRPASRSSPRLSDSMMMTFGVGALLIGLDRGGDAAHLDLEMRLAQAPILAGGLDGGGGLDGLAEGLHRDARRRRDMLAARRARRASGGSDCGVRMLIGQRR